MRRIAWAERQVGDVLLAAVPSIVHDAIWHGELMMHPGAPEDFCVSHAGLLGPEPGWVTEAWLSLTEDSVASVVDEQKYADPLAHGEVELWRPTATVQQCEAAFTRYLNRYVPEGYGIENIFGFAYRALIKQLTGKDIENPIEHSQVCSQGAVDFLTMLYAEEATDMAWILAVDIRDCDPLALRMQFLAQL
jgi:hypothetical protein